MSRQDFNAIDRVVRRLRSKKVQRFTSPGDRVIDVGCGQQNWLVSTAETWAPDSLGIDPNLREEFQGPNGTRETIEQVAADPQRRFDSALSLAVIEHLERDDAPRHLELIRQTLQPGGRVVLTTPTPRSRPVLEFLAFKLKLISADEIADHKHYYSPTEVQDLVRSAGFENVSVKTFQMGFNQVVVAQNPSTDLSPSA